MSGRETPVGFCFTFAALGKEVKRLKNNNLKKNLKLFSLETNRETKTG